MTRIGSSEHHACLKYYLGQASLYHDCITFATFEELTVVKIRCGLVMFIFHLFGIIGVAAGGVAELGITEALHFSSRSSQLL